jgi:hypothetical protein
MAASIVRSHERPQGLVFVSWFFFARQHSWLFFPFPFSFSSAWLQPAPSTALRIDEAVTLYS